MIPTIALFIASKMNIPFDKALRYARLTFLGLIAVGILLFIVLVDRACDSYSRNKAEKERIRLEGNISNAKNEEIGRESAVNDAKNNVNVAENSVKEAQKSVKDAQKSNTKQKSTDANEALRRFECEVEGKCQ